MDRKISQIHHVFLIEDDDYLRSDLSALISVGGYSVHAFRDPTEFLDHAIVVAPVVVLSDMRMPNMSGIELQAKLLERNRPLPVVLMSGVSINREIVQGFKQGALDFLIKPFSREDLFAALSKGIESDLNNMTLMARRHALSLRLKGLSPRELQVFELLKKGFNNQEILGSLKISLETTKQYKQEVMRKLKVKTLSELINLSAVSE